MSHPDLLPDDDEDGYHLDDASSTTSMNYNDAHQRQRTANYFTPEILDIGTGTGQRAIEIADAYPSASVIGFDISAIQPSWVPPNLEWHIGDLEYDLNFGSNRFDLVYVGHMDGLTIEYGKERDTGNLSTLMNDLQRAAEDRGTPLNMAPRYSSQLENAGFQNIHVEKRSIDVSLNLDLVRRTLNAYAKGLLAPDGSESELDEASLRACLAANEFEKGDRMIL
ncbi:hypothetical protein ZTR_10977 [Talaromyces verruculosus]|nr:hypothetical protein ZTR_10977 [Talaromyces verruculosus]